MSMRLYILNFLLFFGKSSLFHGSISCLSSPMVLSLVTTFIQCYNWSSAKIHGIQPSFQSPSITMLITFAHETRSHCLSPNHSSKHSPFNLPYISILITFPPPNLSFFLSHSLTQVLKLWAPLHISAYLTCSFCFLCYSPQITIILHTFFPTDQILKKI